MSLHRAVLLLFCAAGVEAAETASFLKLAPGPRPVGLGEAFTAVADDLNAQTLNPAGLAQLPGRNLGFSHAELFLGTRLDALGYAQPLTAAGGTLAAGVLRLSHGAIAGRDESGNPSGSFEAADTAVQLGYGRRLAGVGMLGINVKYVESRLAYASARGAAVDVGFLRRSRGAWSWGAAIQNAGTGLRYADRTEDFPLALAAGASVRVAGALLLSGEVRNRPHDGGFSAGIGTEYAILPALTIRGGYRSGTDSAGPSTGLSGPAGLGMGFGVRMKRASFDYAFTPQGALGQAQRFSVSTRW